MSEIIPSSNSEQPVSVSKAIGEGKIRLGKIEIDCAVLQDGRRVISQTSLLKAMGRGRPSGRPAKAIVEKRSAGEQIPVFVAANNLIPFIPRTLTESSGPILFVSASGRSGKGYDAAVLADVCDTYLSAAAAGVLTKDQLPIAATLRIVQSGLSRVGIAAIVDEACGIVREEKDGLQRILEAFISKELLPWTKRFPREFFDHYRRLYRIADEKGSPRHLGLFILKYVYDKLAPGVVDELKRRNPVDEEKRRRLHAHHQFLTPTIGCPALEKRVIRVMSFLESCDSLDEFKRKKNRVLGSPGTQDSGQES